MQRSTIAIVGFGDLGARVFQRLPADKWRCCALRRRAEEVPAGVEGIAVDLRRPETLSVLGNIKPRALMITLSPDGRSAADYRAGFANAMAAIVAGLGAHQPEHALFVSSTRVYREAAGGWVDEASPVAVDNPQVSAILEAEQRLCDALPAARVLRAGGLYGGAAPGPLLRRVVEGRLTPREPPRYSNRMHRDDLAGFVEHALGSPPEPGIINLVDNEPAPIQTVEAWFCEQLGRVYDPPAAPPCEAGQAPSVAPHKRIANARLRASGYRLRYPDFRAGYAELLRRWTAHSEGEDGLDLN